jgi:hypothetical protein
MSTGNPAPASESVPVPTQERLRRGDLTLPMVWNTLPVNQLYGLCATVVAFFAGSFAVGLWVGNQDGRAELRQKTDDWSTKESKFKTDMEALTTTNAKLSGANEVFKVKQRFLATTLAYYQADGPEHLPAERALVSYLKEMWKNGKQDIDKNGYEIFHNPDTPTSICYIMFKGDPIHYKIPPGPKGEVLMFMK